MPPTQKQKPSKPIIFDRDFQQAWIKLKNSYPQYFCSNDLNGVRTKLENTTYHLVFLETEDNDLRAVLKVVNSQSKVMAYIKLGAHRSIMDNFLYQFVEKLKKCQALPAKLTNFFVESSPVLIDLTKAQRSKNCSDEPICIARPDGDFFDVEPSQVCSDDENKASFYALGSLQLALPNYNVSEQKSMSEHDLLMALLFTVLNGEDIKLDAMVGTKSMQCCDFEDPLHAERGNVKPAIHMPYLAKFKDKMVSIEQLARAQSYVSKWLSEQVLHFLSTQNNAFYDAYPSNNSDDEYKCPSEHQILSENQMMQYKKNVTLLMKNISGILEEKKAIKVEDLFKHVCPSWGTQLESCLKARNIEQVELTDSNPNTPQRVKKAVNQGIKQGARNLYGYWRMATQRSPYTISGTMSKDASKQVSSLIAGAKDAAKENVEQSGKPVCRKLF